MKLKKKTEFILRGVLSIVCT